MRKPGLILLRLAESLSLTRLRDTVLLPAIADLQHECGEAGSDRRHAWVLARGYWAIVSGCAFYAAFLPSRHLRENWAGLEAPVPRLLRSAGRIAALVLVLTSGLGLATWPNERGLGFGQLALPLPSMILGSREMTFRELGMAASAANLSACPPKTGMSACGGGPSPAFLRTEWHNRLSMPAFVFSFVILAAGLSRSGRRAVVIPGLLFSHTAALILMNFGEKLAAQGDVSVVLAAWAPHLVPLGLAALLSRRVTPGDRGSVLSDDSLLRP